MRARYYDPSVGRFISEDPAYAGGNWYAYCDNNPLNETDGTGKEGKGIEAGPYDAWATLGTVSMFAAVTMFNNRPVAAAMLAGLAAICYGMAFTWDHNMSDNDNRFWVMEGVVGVCAPLIVTLLAGAATLEDACPVGVAKIAIMAVAVEGIAVVGAMASIGVDA